MKFPSLRDGVLPVDSFAAHFKSVLDKKGPQCSAHAIVVVDEENALA
jgi:hypothetical protein